MKTQVTFRHLKSRPELYEAAEEAIKRFEKFNDSIISINVEFIQEAQNVCEFRIHINGNVLAVREASDDFEKSLNLAADKVVRQLKKQKEKAKEFTPVEEE